MTHTSSTTARSAGGAPRRRAKKPKAPPEGAGAAEDGSYGADTTPAENAAAAEPAAPKGLRRWLGRARALGLTAPQLVFELHARQGVPLLEVAHVLELGLEAVRGHWLQARAARAAQAPQTEADYALLREHLCEVLWQTVEATYPEVVLAAEEAAADAPVASSPPMLSVRLKALDQIAKLYDLGVEQSTPASGPLPYATPEEIAASVRERLLEMHGQGE